MAGAASAIAASWFQARQTTKSQIFQLELANAALRSDLEKVKVDSKIQIDKLQFEKSELQTYVDKCLSRDARQSNYTTDAPSGDLVREGFHFCPFCFHDSDPPKEVQMQQLHGGDHWCRVCGKPERFIKNNA